MINYCLILFLGEFKSTADYQYQLLRCNVDLLKIIQLGLTFLDETGKLPETGPSTWQFNFKFNLTEDMYAEDSVDLLQVRIKTILYPKATKCPYARKGKIF